MRETGEQDGLRESQMKRGRARGRVWREGERHRERDGEDVIREIKRDVGRGRVRKDVFH